MTRRLLITIACAAVSIGISANGRTDATGSIVVTVTAANGESVAGLTVDDFSVAIDSHGEDIVSFAAGPAALSAVVLLDQSGSVTEITKPDTDPAVQALAVALRPEDRIQIGSIASGTSISPWTTPMKRELEAAFRALPKPAPFAASPIWDAVNAGVRALSAETGRRLVILVTDGRTTASRLSIDEAATAAINNHVAVSTIDRGRQQLLRQDNAGGIAVRATPSLLWISRGTGGLYYDDQPTAIPVKQSNVDLSIAHAIRDQRAAYTLTMAVPDDKKFHDIHVRCVDPTRVTHAPSVIRASTRQ